MREDKIGDIELPPTRLGTSTGDHVWEELAMTESDAPASTRAARTRPLSPHLTTYRWPITMTMSILHRITGGALYFGMLLLVWWLVAAATSERAFVFIDGIVRSWFGLLALVGFTWALMHHLIGGLRHLIWDSGVGLEKQMASRLSWATIFASVALTFFIFAAALAVG